MFAIFYNIETFNTWHKAIKLKLNYPLIGTNAATSKIDLINISTEYTDPKINKMDTQVIAWVGDEQEGLQIIDPNDIQWSAWFQSKVLGLDA